MTDLGSLPVTWQNLTCFWALLLCLGCIADVLLLLRQKRYGLCAAGGTGLLLSYLALHVCQAGTVLRRGGQAPGAARLLLGLPWAGWTALLSLLTLLWTALLISVFVWRRSHITSASIKESADGLPAGLCYYLEDGRTIFSNHRMNDICCSLLGRSLPDGAALRAFVGDRAMLALSDGTAVSFRHRLLSYHGAALHELIADDVTELYEKTERLRADNERSRLLAAGMKAYGETVGDTVRRQEILQAKANIHDEMNRMILATSRAAREGSEEDRRQILRMWQNRALLLCREADGPKGSSTVDDLNALASVIGLRLRWNRLPDREDGQGVLSLFLASAREAIVNAVKHAGAKTLAIDLEETPAALLAGFVNDGEAPAGPVTETGGLRVLRKRLEAAGGQMNVETQPVFRLTVVIPKEEDRRGL